MARKKNADELATPFRNMSVETDDINILLLGETGIGKSTFINAFTNYLHYKSFDEAESRDVKCLVPAKFEITDDGKDGKFEKSVVSIGEDQNENTSITSAATQSVRSYLFPLPDRGHKRLRLIDTPGICDDRGIEQDKENLENVLSYITKIERLHAICILLKPNNARLTVAFQYCVTTLLSRLEKTAGKNIVFVFTNARSTFYKPGDTSAAVVKILDSIARNPPHVKIRFEKENVFCLDNESFRYLAALKQKMKLANKESFVESWRISVDECNRLIKYVLGEGATKIEPHEVCRTISVNKARQVILELSKPLADITELINDNVHVLQKQRKVLEIDYTSIETLKSQLYVPVVNLEQIECKQPKTVCANSKCCETIAVGDLKKLHYKQRCHDPCYLQNIPREIIGDKGLVHCAAMNSSGQCKHCQCDFSAHMHIYYETKTVNGRIEGAGVKAQIVDRETAIEASKKIIREIEQRKGEFEAEKKTIVKAMAKFAHFLEHNAISPFNDSYKAYIGYLIKRESSRGSDCNVQTVQSLEALLKQYNEEKQILEDALKSRPGDMTANVTADMVLNEIKHLYALPRTGTTIRNLHNLQKRGEASEHKNTEFVLDKVESYDSDSSGGANRGRNTKRGRGRGNKGNILHEESKFKTNKRGGYQNQFGKDKFQNERYMKQFQHNLPDYQKQTNQTNQHQNWRARQGQNPGFPNQGYWQNAPNNLGNNRNTPNQPNAQPYPPPLMPPNYFQGGPLNYPNLQLNPALQYLLMNYPNVPPSTNQYDPSQRTQNPNQPFPEYSASNPPQNSSEKNRTTAPQNIPTAPPNNTKAPKQNYNKKNDEKVYWNKLDSTDEYNELYGYAKEFKTAASEAKNYYSKDSDSDNEGAKGFESFRKSKGLDKQRCDYEDLYGDHDDDYDDKSSKSTGFLSAMKSMFK